MILLFNKILEATRDLALPLDSTPKLHVMFQDTSASQQVTRDGAKSRPDIGIFRSTDVRDKGGNHQPSDADRRALFDKHAFDAAIISPKGANTLKFNKQIGAVEVKVFGKSMSDIPETYEPNTPPTVIPAIPPKVRKNPGFQYCQSGSAATASAGDESGMA